jgi:hypothetical protein
VDVLADPGCYCYHGEPAWRAYFRSTLGHNTLELGGTNQSASGGPFMWVRHAKSRVLLAHPDPAGVSYWIGEHTGYSRGRNPVVHRRTAELDGQLRCLRLVDELSTDRCQPARLAFHLGPRVAAEIDGHCARLQWTDPAGVQRTAMVTLPGALAWRAYRGQLDPPLGWYSSGFGKREPSVSLVGQGWVEPHTGPLCSMWELDG